MEQKTKRPGGSRGVQGIDNSALLIAAIPQTDAVPQGAALLRYDNIKKLAKELNRPASTLIALSPSNDPFSITPARHDGAHWFARIWKRFRLGPGTHVRRVHYKLISQAAPIKMSNGMPFKNTAECWEDMIGWSNDARYLDIVPAEDFIDRRNAKPLIYLPVGSRSGSLCLINNAPDVELASAMPDLPALYLIRPTNLQRYHIELWCEKTTANDILEPIARKNGCNVITGMGELSQTACVNVVERAAQSGLPVRILYISDFDPGGLSMPVAVARKIEHRLYLKNLDLDIQVRPIALTLEQCQKFRLPRTPIKEGERRAAAFEERFGDGATELDALEALHPGELQRIIEREIDRYFDDSIDECVRDKAAEVEYTLSKINRNIQAEHRAEIKALKSAWERMVKQHARQIAQWQKRANPI
jgi:hypothetical protein